MTHSVTASLIGALRAFRRRPGFFAIAVSSLGIALGLSTAVFAMIDALRHPLVANTNIDRTFYIGLRGDPAPGRSRPREAEYARAIEALPSFDGKTTVQWARVNAEANNRSHVRDANYVRPSYFDIVGLRPAIGRMFGADEYAQGNAVIVSAGVWKTLFNNRPVIGDATIAVDGNIYPVVGVLPLHARAADILLPVPESYMVPMRGASTIVRLKPGRTIETMQGELDAASASLIAQLGRGPAPFRWELRSFRPDPLGLSDYHRALIGAAIGILLIACANVAALMLARGMASRRDYALLLALGATPRDLARRIFGEVAVLGVAGALFGGLLAAWATRILTVSVPEDMTNLGLPAPQWTSRVFIIGLVATLAAIGFAAALPAWFAARTQPNEPLKDNAGTTTGRSASRFRLLVVGEIALAMTLLMGASLMAKSVRAVAGFDFGYDGKDLISASVYQQNRNGGHVNLADSSQRRTFDENARGAHDMIARIRAVPGVASAASLLYALPAEHTVISDRTADGAPSIFTAEKSFMVIGATFFATMGIRLAEGKDFSEGDRPGAVLSASAARVLFPNGGAVGRLVKFGDVPSQRTWYPVVGIAPDVHMGFPNVDPAQDELAVPDMYVYDPAFASSTWSAIVRPGRTDAHVISAVARTLEDFAPAGATVSVRPQLTSYESKLRSVRYIGRIFVLLGACSLILAAAGLFSVLSFAVNQRMREFAVRMALGARRIDITRLVFRDALMMALAGTAIGAGLGMWGGFMIWYVMWGVYPVDAGALVIAEGALLTASVLACLVPAMRAMRANPVDVMRAT